jgi:GNAT superfamily N-acetyltransferase
MAKCFWRVATAQLPVLWIDTELTPKTEAQLIAFSQSDELVRSQTHDAERFTSSEVIKTWVKGRELIILETEAEELLGIVWLSHKVLPSLPPEYQLTFGIRLYENARGKGLAIPFLKMAFGELKKTALWKKHSDAKVWLETKAFNKPALETYKALGFVQHTQPDSEQEIIMLQASEL